MKISQNKNGKWMIDFTCKHRRIRRVIGKNKRDAEAAMSAIKTDILREKYGFAKQKKEMLFVTFAKEFFELHSKQKRSWRRDKISIKNLRSYFKGKLLSGITPDMIEKYKAKRKAKVSPATVNREIACLKTLFNKALEWGKLEKSPAQKVKLLKENNVKERILTDREARQLIDASNSHIKSVLIIALNTGMRKNEILSLKWKNINFTKGYIFIEDSKSGRSRKIPMNQMVFESLKSIKQNSEFVFYNHKTKSYIKDIKTAFKTACKRAKIEDLRMHDLRHTAASKMIEAGIDLVTASKILGHSSIQMTMRYAHPTPENMQRAVNKLGEIFQDSQHREPNDSQGDEIKHTQIPQFFQN